MNSFFLTCGFFVSVFQIFVFLAVMCLILAIGNCIWESDKGYHFQVYLPWAEDVTSAPFSAFLMFWSYVIILNTVVPISLYVRYVPDPSFILGKFELLAGRRLEVGDFWGPFQSKPLCDTTWMQPQHGWSHTAKASSLCCCHLVKTSHSPTFLTSQSRSHVVLKEQGVRNNALSSVRPFLLHLKKRCKCRMLWEWGWKFATTGSTMSSPLCTAHWKRWIALSLWWLQGSARVAT